MKIRSYCKASDAVPSDASIQLLEKRLTLSVLVVALAVGAANYYGRVQIYSDTLRAALTSPSVWLTTLAGIAIFAAGLFHARVARGFQAAVIFALACMKSFESVTGDLTSLVFFGLSLMVAAQYGLLVERQRIKIAVVVVTYGVFFVYGTYTRSNSTSLGAVLNLIGAGFLAYIFVVIASLRLKEMAGRQEELARLVAERTKELETEVERRAAAETEARSIADHNQRLAGDRAVLLKELHHRSKNDLQMILSLLSLRAEKGDHPELVELFRPTQDRIRAIALVHEQLDGSERFDAIGLQRYLERLLEYVQVSHADYSVRIHAEIDSDIAVKLESATHLGLLIHELVLSSYLYSLRPSSAGTISVRAATSGPTLVIRIADSGVGLPDNVNPDAPDQDEIGIVAGLVRRLRCTLTLAGDEDTTWTATIPLDAIQHQDDPVSVSA